MVFETIWSCSLVILS